jgi:hypothetical protein
MIDINRRQLIDVHGKEATGEQGNDAWRTPVVGALGSLQRVRNGTIMYHSKAKGRAYLCYGICVLLKRSSVTW